MDEKLRNDRRVKPRLLCAELIGVIWIDKSTEEHRRIANLDDISTNGACIQVDQFIEVGTPMTLQYSGGEFTGAVRYCCYRDGNYFVGIEFDEGSEWSRKDFHPKHLFDPRRIVPQSLRRPSKYIH